jgi:hypothetical protein
MNDAHDYQPGYSDHEARPLADQGVLLEDLTQDMLRRAGLQPGMHVLEIWCSVGDVSLLADGRPWGVRCSASTELPCLWRRRARAYAATDAAQQLCLSEGITPAAGA